MIFSLMAEISFTLNGTALRFDAKDDTMLVWALRERLGAAHGEHRCEARQLYHDREEFTVVGELPLR